jgi:hypothetical protein
MPALSRESVTGRIEPPRAGGLHKIETVSPYTMTGLSEIAGIVTDAPLAGQHDSRGKGYMI